MGTREVSLRMRKGGPPAIKKCRVCVCQCVATDRRAGVHRAAFRVSLTERLLGAPPSRRLSSSLRCDGLGRWPTAGLKYWRGSAGLVSVIESCGDGVIQCMYTCRKIWFICVVKRVFVESSCLFDGKNTLCQETRWARDFWFGAKRHPSSRPSRSPSRAIHRPEPAM